MQTLFIEFLNTRWPVGGAPHADPLRDPDWVRKFLERRHLPADSPLSEQQISELSNLRAVLGRAVTAIASGEPIGQEASEEINRHLGAAALHYALEPDEHGAQVALRPTLNGWSGVLQGIVLSFAEFLSEQDPARLRECGNPDCRWIFYDETKNASRKWCDNKCASLVKVRRFRERRKNESNK